MNLSTSVVAQPFAMKTPQKSPSGFTLIELIVVIAILSLISTLAVNRIGAIRERAARSVSVANQLATGRAVETYLTANDGKLNRLDSLLDADAYEASLPED